MAMSTHVTTLGVDVAKSWFDIFDGQSVHRIDNTDRAIRAFLRSQVGPVRIAVEPTHRYHLRLLQRAIAAGHTVYLVDPYRLSRYRDAVGMRAKTDRHDARLLARYLNAEASRLTPYVPAPKAVQKLQQLLRAHAKLTQSKTTMKLSLQDIGELACTRKALIKRLDQAIALIDKKLIRCVHDAGYTTDYDRCLTIPGVGPQNAAALVAIFHRGAFRNADAFIAFMGLDVRVRDSGRYRGLRKLTKRGSPQLRRLLFNAARSGAQTTLWNPYYQALRSRGFSTTAAYVALARKIARLAFALLRDQSQYQAPTHA